jgi:hypothetical protein
MVEQSMDLWEFPARLRLGERGVSPAEADRLIAEVRNHLELSGSQDPTEEFGTPEEFADAVAAEKGADRLPVDAHGGTPGEYLAAAGIAFCLGAIVLAVLGAIDAGGLQIPVTPAGLAGSVTLGLVCIAALGAPSALRAAGRPRWANAAFPIAGALIVAAASFFTWLPKTHLAEIPVPLLVLAASAGIWLMLRPSRSKKAGGAKAPMTTAAWLKRLDQLLVGRFDVTPVRARELTGQAREHLEATGRSAEEEFGPVHAYAQELARSGQPRRPAWWRTPQAEYGARVVAVVGILGFAVSYWIDGPLWQAVLGTVVGLWFGRDLVRDAWDRLRG